MPSHTRRDSTCTVGRTGRRRRPKSQAQAVSARTTQQHVQHTRSSTPVSSYTFLQARNQSETRQRVCALSVRANAPLLWVAKHAVDALQGLKLLNSGLWQHVHQ